MTNQVVKKGRKPVVFRLDKDLSEQDLEKLAAEVVRQLGLQVEEAKATMP